MKRIPVFFVLVLIITFCEAQKKTYIANIKNLNVLDNNAAIYALPKTVLNITAQASRTTIIPGPYYEYADKYLGIQNVTERRTTQWNITDIQINVCQEADQEYFFTLGNIRFKAADQILSGLAEDSLILLPDRFFKKYSFSEPDTSYGNRIYYTDLSVKRNFYLSNDTAYKKVFRDSVYVNMPVIKQKPVRKTLEEKAEEAANYIIKIRKRKFKLMSGQYDYMPEGEALEVAVKEMEKLESEYLSLFTGKKYIDNYKKTFQYIPDNTREISKEVLFRFSGTEGFIDPRQAKGKLVIIEIKDMNRTMYFDELNINSSGSLTGNYVLVRLPDLADIRVLIGEKILNESKVPVFQYGSMVPFSFK
ncbi:MAG: DUF4831 family protein [Bacteroidales bacterium]|nr:MAG: DUF4831 family protein [Bacteroidales bacterium]